MIEPLERKSLLSPFAINGDEMVAEAYSKIMYQHWNISAKFDKYFPRGTYGEDLDLILFEFFVLGDTDWFSAPKEICLGRYSRKNKDFSVKVPVPKEVSAAVLNGNDEIVNDFLVNTFSTAKELIFSKKSFRKLDFNFEKFESDYNFFMNDLVSK